jgi:hypothetical protein
VTPIIDFLAAFMFASMGLAALLAGVALLVIVVRAAK